MVVAFVGFVSRWPGADLAAQLGAGHRFAAALAASIVTWFTFPPSSVFILAGGPLVESTDGELAYTAPLAAITAAVVGVNLDLAPFFGYHLLWPDGFDGRFEWPVAPIAFAAGVAVFGFRRGVIEVIAGCAVAGLVAQLVR